MKTLTTVILLGLSLFFAACQQEKKEADEEALHVVDEGVIDMHTAKIALDYVGVYRGVLPTASGAGAEVTIELKEDGTYYQSMQYRGRENGFFENRGDYVWDDSGMVIELKGVEGSGLYFVAENLIVKLDENGEKVYSELSDHYVLEKQTDNE